MTATPNASLGFKTTIETFQMRHCMMLYHKGHQNCQNTVVFLGSIIGQEIFAQNCGFIVGKGVKIMISEG